MDLKINGTEKMGKLASFFTEVSPDKVECTLGMPELWILVENGADRIRERAVTERKLR